MGLALGCILIIDLVSFALGIAVLATALYVITTYRYFEVLFPLYTIYISLTVGIVLMFIGLCGCWSSMQAKRGLKTFIGCYIVLVVACLCANIASFVLFNDLGGLIVTQESLVSGSLVKPQDIQLNNALLSTYTACCIGCSEECNNAQPFFNHTLPNCRATNGTEFCMPVEVCNGNPDQMGCFVHANGVYPPVQIDYGICDAFTKLDRGDGIHLVSPAIRGGCGGGDAATYADDVLLFFADQLHYLYIALGVLCGFQALNLIAALCVFATEGMAYRY